MPKIVPIEKFQKSTFFVLVTGVFWRRRFACSGQRFENAKSSDKNDESEEDEKPLINKYCACIHSNSAAFSRA